MSRLLGRTCSLVRSVNEIVTWALCVKTCTFLIRLCNWAHIKLPFTLLEQFPLQDYQTRPEESNYVTDLRSHAYSEDHLPLGRECHRQKSHLPTSSCSWENSSALEAAPPPPSSPDALGHAFEKMRTKTNTLSARPDYRASYSATAPHMRKHPDPGEVELDNGLDHSDHCCRRSDRFTAFSSRSGQSVEHCSEVYPLIILTVLNGDLCLYFLNPMHV